MTISTYQVDNVIKAYHKQIRLHQRASQMQRRDGYYIDEVCLSSRDRKDIYQKISYSLKDILLKDRV
ncbi:MAG: hypothetical protein JW902_08400 [Syntrophaceae bacterium]|nr:hypothetical protein [Syntrophaceae bacterium]